MEDTKQVEKDLEVIKLLELGMGVYEYSVLCRVAQELDEEDREPEEREAIQAFLVRYGK